MHWSYKAPCNKVTHFRWKHISILCEMAQKFIADKAQGVAIQCEWSMDIILQTGPALVQGNDWQTDEMNQQEVNVSLVLSDIHFYKLNIFIEHKVDNIIPYEERHMCNVALGVACLQLCCV